MAHSHSAEARRIADRRANKTKSLLLSRGCPGLRPHPPCQALPDIPPSPNRRGREF